MSVFTPSKRFVWRYPEWWTAALCALAWLTIVMQAASPHAHHHHGQLWTTSMSNWMLMVVAMMFPLVLDSVRRTAARSLWTRRHRAIAGFLLGYLSLWAAVGVLASFIPAKSAAAGFALAAIWQLTPMKSRAVLSCHRTMPLTPTGWRADLDCIRFGWHIGGGCLISCWALMLACVLSGHALFAMVAITAAAITERYATQIAPGLICAALSLCAVGYVLVN